LWKLPAVLVAGVVGSPPVFEGYAGRAPPLSLSAVASLHHGRHRPRGAGGRRKSGTPLALADRAGIIAAGATRGTWSGALSGPAGWESLVVTCSAVGLLR